MNSRRPAIAISFVIVALGVILAIVSESSAAPARPRKQSTARSEMDEILERQTRDSWVVILGAYRDFHEAKSDAIKFAKSGSLPFSLNGMIFDKKGLHYPRDYADEIFAGEYIARRHNVGWDARDNQLAEHISIERSDGYDGFAKGYYIIVGSIAATKQEGLVQAARFKAFAPDTYVKKTRIYMGCMH